MTQYDESRADDPCHEVRKPRHYNSHPSGIECIRVVEHMTFSSGNAVKYLWRAGLKTADSEMPIDAQLKDLEKALTYIEFEVARVKQRRKEQTTSNGIGATRG